MVFATCSGQAAAGLETLRIRVPARRPARDRVFATDGLRALRKAGCDVVLAIRHALACDVYLPHGGLVDDALAAKDEACGGAGAWRRLGRRFGGKHAFFREAESALLGGREGPVVIAVSEMVRARIRTRYPAAAARAVTVVNGVDVEHFERAAHAEAGLALRRELGLEVPLVGLLLAHHPRLKGAETAIRALADRPSARWRGRWRSSSPAARSTGTCGDSPSSSAWPIVSAPCPPGRTRDRFTPPRIC